jgi:small-conductance mechanosensitive channel
MNLNRLLLCGCFCWNVALASDAPTSPVEKNNDVTLTVENREIVTFRSSVLGIEPLERMQRAQSRIEKQLGNGAKHQASMLAMAPGILIQIDGAGSFYIAPGDVDPYQQETLESVAKKALDNLTLAISESHDSRSLDYMLRAAGYAFLATLIYVVMLWLVRRIRNMIERRILAFTDEKIDQLGEGSAQIVSRERIQWVLSRLVQACAWLLILLLSYEWLSVLLEQFPLTRPWGENLNGYFVGLVVMLGTAILKAIPDLFTAVVIFVLARIATRALSRFFARIQTGKVQFSWLDPEVALPTKRIANMAIWLFALAMAYPYLPGANTEAFKGVSVLVGLMISMGASGLVGQVVSGLILTYTGIYRKGEFIHVQDYQGSIVEMGMFTTRIRNGMGVELTLPNSLVLNNVTQNYSRAVHGEGFIVNTKVTIGYDTPWRQVQEMLILAAQKTPGVIGMPAPKVFQTALADFYPEYLLVCQAIPCDAQLRAEVMSQLHANIQDVFNEYGVQIMSPNYLGDPDNEKLVPKSEWFKAPVRNT